MYFGETVKYARHFVTWKLCLTVEKSGHHSMKPPWSSKCAACMPVGQCYQSKSCFKTQEMTMLEMLYQPMEGCKQDARQMADVILAALVKETKKRRWGKRSPSVKMESMLAVPRAHFLWLGRKLAVSVWVLVGKCPCMLVVMNSCWLFLLLAAWVVRSCSCPRGELLTGRTGWQPQEKACSASGALFVGVGCWCDVTSKQQTPVPISVEKQD